MPYNLITQQPDSPIEEKWTWLSDVLVADDGSEQRISLSAYPKRTFSGSYSFTDEPSIRHHVVTLFNSGAPQYFPLWQHSVCLKASATLGDSALSLNALRSDFKAGGRAFISEGDTSELVDILLVTGGGVTLVAPLAHSYTKRALVSPVAVIYMGDTATMSRRSPNNAASAQFAVNELGFNAPFVNPLNTAILTMFDGLPLLDKNAQGGTYDDAAITGLEVTDYPALESLRRSWLETVLAMNRNYLCNRVLNPTDWDWWIKFLDYCKGAVNPFLLPTFRSDFAIDGFAGGGATTISLKGNVYSDNYFMFDTYKRIAITTDAGVHYAKVSASVKGVGFEVLTFSPAVPAGVNWSIKPRISLLLKMRMGDGMVTCEHSGFSSNIAINMRTAV